MVVEDHVDQFSPFPDELWESEVGMKKMALSNLFNMIGIVTARTIA